MRKLLLLSAALAVGYSTLAAGPAGITLKRLFRIGGGDNELIYRCVRDPLLSEGQGASGVSK